MDNNLYMVVAPKPKKKQRSYMLEPERIAEIERLATLNQITHSEVVSQAVRDAALWLALTKNDARGAK